MFAYSLIDSIRFMETKMQANKRKLAEAVFSARSSYRELTTSQVEAEVVFNDLFCLASGFRKETAVTLLAKINQDISLYRQFRDLVHLRQFDQSKSLAAASSGLDLPIRQTDKFILKFKRDRVEPDQIFALLSIAHPTVQHCTGSVVVNVFAKDNCEQFVFPAIVDGSSQLLFEQSDSRLKLLMDANTEISIMP